MTDGEEPLSIRCSAVIGCIDLLVRTVDAAAPQANEHAAAVGDFGQGWHAQICQRTGVLLAWLAADGFHAITVCAAARRGSRTGAIAITFTAAAMSPRSFSRNWPASDNVGKPVTDGAITKIVSVPTNSPTVTRPAYGCAIPVARRMATVISTAPITYTKPSNARNGKDAWSRPTTGLGSTNFSAPIQANMTARLIRRKGPLMRRAVLMSRYSIRGVLLCIVGLAEVGGRYTLTRRIDKML